LQTKREPAFIVEVTSLPGRHGTVVFDGSNKTSPRKRRFWVIENAGEMQFTIEYNDLKSIPILPFRDSKQVSTSRLIIFWTKFI